MKKLLFTFLAAMCCMVMAIAANGTKISGIYYILDDVNFMATATWGGDNASYNSKDYKATSVETYKNKNRGGFTNLKKNVDLSKAKEEAKAAIDREMEGITTFTVAEQQSIQSYKDKIDAATTEEEIIANKNAALEVIDLRRYKDEAIADLKEFVKDMVGVDITEYVSNINNAESIDQVNEKLKNAKSFISTMKFATIGAKKYKLEYDQGTYTLGGSITINDKDLYQSDNDFTVKGLTYSRTFANTDWQPLYVPFAMSYDEWKKNFEVAAINNFHEYSDDTTGEILKTELEIRKVKSGTLKPNHPYLIRAKSADASTAKTIDVSSKKLCTSDANSIVCSSVETKYTFTGTYKEMTDLYKNDYIFMSGGKLSKANNDDVTLSPQRWYLKIESLGSQIIGDDESDSANAKAMQFNIKLLDDDATGIEEITVTRTPLQNGGKAIYNLSGMCVADTYKGIVIINGKKYIRK